MTKGIRHAVKWLRENFPVDARVVVKVCDRAGIRNPNDPEEYCGHDGLCRFHTKAFTILIASDLPEEMQIVTLDHEWAHAMAFPRQTRKFHTRDWERAYGAIAAAREKHLGNP